MPNVAKVGFSTAGGVITGPGIPNILVEGQPISVVGDLISYHGDPPHSAPTITTGSATVKAGFRSVTIADGPGISTASCGHKASIGAPTVLIGL